MKKLICAKDVEHAVAAGEHVIYVDASTIITPSARDVAANAGISFSEGCAPTATTAADPAASTACEKAAPQTAGTLDSNLIYKALQILTEKGMLGQLMNAVGVDAPYVSESDSAGMVKLVRSNTAKFQLLDTGHPGDQVYYNELIGAGDGVPLNAGFMTIDRCTFSWNVDCQEIYYVIDGTLTVEKDGRVFTAGVGDCLLFKRGARLTFGTPGKVKVFYVTH